jgi:MerR family transcriptional regulator, heat shock protein HspR
MNKGYYSIGVVSEMLGIHPQTIRYYEKEGLVRPNRSPGKTRLYSDEDVQRLRAVHSLARDHGVNMAGIRIILQLKESCDEELRRVHAEHGEMVEYLMRLVKSRLEEMIEANPAMPVPVFSRFPMRYGTS